MVKRNFSFYDNFQKFVQSYRVGAWCWYIVLLTQKTIKTGFPPTKVEEKH